MSGDRTCSVEACDRPVHSRGWCKPHYRRWQRHGATGSEPIREKARPQPPRPCKVDGCRRVAQSRGWCGTHYERWRLGRAVNAPGDLRLRNPAARCTVDGCEGRPSARGWCQKHYARWRAHGDPTVTERDYGSYRVTSPDGYIRIWCPGHPAAHADGYALEHRKVVIDAGIEIPDGWHVHHRNHDKTDNRLENLEVLSPAEHQSEHALGCNQHGHHADCALGGAA